LFLAIGLGAFVQVIYLTLITLLGPVSIVAYLQFILFRYLTCFFMGNCFAVVTITRNISGWFITVILLLFVKVWLVLQMIPDNQYIAGL
jgi:hypothetical protein